MSAGGFNQNGAGLNELAGDITTTNNNISFATGVTFKGDLVMDTFSESEGFEGGEFEGGEFEGEVTENNPPMGNISFADVIDSDFTARALTLNTGTGNATFTAAVGNTQALGSLIINSGGLTTFAAAVATTSLQTDAPGTTAINGATVTTSDTQTYNDNLTLGDNTVLTGTTVTTNGTIAGGEHSLSVVGNAVFGDTAGDTVTGLSALTVSEITAINTSNITSSGTQDYTGAVTIGADTTLTTTNATVTFGATIDLLSAAAKSLTVNAGSGDVNLMDVVGAGAVFRLPVII
jgi:hypothetical protein